MLIKYQEIKLPDWKLKMVEQANEIIEEYADQGYTLTLRQLYYQFVSRDILPAHWANAETGSTNNERSYKNLGTLISDARLGGLISWEAIVDRTRELTATAIGTVCALSCGGQRAATPTISGPTNPFASKYG
jgi:hypothetical protein